MTINMLNFGLHTIKAIKEDKNYTLNYSERVTGEVFKVSLGGPFSVVVEGDDEWGYQPYVRWNEDRKEELFQKIGGFVPTSLIEECERHNNVAWESFATSFVITESYEGDEYRPGTRYSSTTKERFFFYDPTQIVLGPNTRQGLKGWIRDVNFPLVRNASSEHLNKYESAVYRALFREGAAYIANGLVQKVVTPEEEFCLQWKHFQVQVDGVTHYLAVTPGYRETSNDFPTTFEVGLFHAPKGWKARRKTAVKTFGYIRYGDALLTEPECLVQYKAQVDALWETAIQELIQPQPKVTSSGKPLPIKKK